MLPGVGRGLLSVNIGQISDLYSTRYAVYCRILQYILRMLAYISHAVYRVYIISQLGHAGWNYIIAYTDRQQRTY